MKRWENVGYFIGEFRTLESEKQEKTGYPSKRKAPGSPGASFSK